MSSTDTAKQLNVLLEPQDRLMLDKIAEHEDAKCSQIIRRLIRWRYHMTFGQRPTCADGQQCKCPQMHSLLPPAPPIGPSPGPAAA